MQAQFPRARKPADACDLEFPVAIVGPVERRSEIGGETTSQPSIQGFCEECLARGGPPPPPLGGSRAQAGDGRAGRRSLGSELRPLRTCAHPAIFPAYAY